MGYTLKYHPLVKTEDIPRLDKRTANRIKQAIEARLATEPQKYGEPLRKTLKGFWKLRVGDYRVVFRVEDDSILVLGIIHRKEVYQRVEKSRI